MTVDAQAALRRIIEAHAKTTRFCIICNYISKIIDPLASRCVKFRFSPIGEDAQRDRLLKICEAEEVKVESEIVVSRLIEITEGDLRRSINTLQTCSAFAKGEGRSLTKEHIENVSGVVPDRAIKMISAVVGKRDSTYGDIQNVAAELVYEGYDCQQLLHQLLDFYIVQPTNSVSDIKKAKISEIIAMTDF